MSAIETAVQHGLVFTEYAAAKVKALNPPGKANGRQNHAFSLGCEFLLP